MDMLSNGELLSFEPYIARIRELYGDVDTLPLETRKEQFIDSVRPYVEDGTYTKEMCNDFCKYYLEKKPKGRKFRFEKYPTFDVKLRLITWAKRSKQYSIIGMLNKKK